MNPIDLKYCGIMSMRLERYEVKERSPYRANMRCPICGDSEKSKVKARGWILDKKNQAFYYCHNCGASMTLGYFIKQVAPTVYDEYVIDSRLERDTLRRQVDKIKTGLDTLRMSKPKFKTKESPLHRIKKISSMKDSHPAKQYITKRQIPTDKHYLLYYAPKFNSWVNSVVKDKLSSDYDEPRLITPFIDEHGNLFGFAGRSFDPNANLRYITIMLDEDMPKMFGMNTVDFNKPYFVVEGQFDSMFLDNCVAMAGADGNSRGLKNLGNATYVFDNEPRNKEIVARMEKVANRGDKVVIWPQKLPGKDINDLVLAGLSPKIVSDILVANTYQGLDAKLALTIWKRC